MRRAPAIGFAVAFAAMLYTHNWALFFGAATGLAWLWLLWRADAAERRRLLRTGAARLRRRAAALRCRGSRPRSTRPPTPGRRGRNAPSLAALASVPGADPRRGRRGRASLLAAGAGVVRAAGAAAARPARAIVALLVIAVLTIVLAWLASQLSPAWATRYLAAGVPRRSCCSPRPASRTPAGSGSPASRSSPCCGRSTARRTEKSNVRDVAEAIAPSLRPGDLVVATQPEQVSVLDYYLPDGLRYATLTGPVPDVGVTDWRDGVERLERRRRARDLRAAARLGAARPAARARRAADLLGQPLARAVDVARAAALGGVAAARSRTTRASRSSDVEPADPFPRARNPVRAAGLPQALTRSRPGARRLGGRARACAA